MAKLIDLNGLAHVYSIIKGMLADKLGKNDTAVNAAKVNNLTVETAVPKNAKFTDTVYTHPSTHPASMITGLASVATSGSYNDLSDKPTMPEAIIVDDTLSGTSTNAIQNKAVATQFVKMEDAVENALGTALNKKADKASLATVATSGSYTDLSNRPTVVKTVNNTAPDENGNVTITTSGGGDSGVSLSAENTWTGKQTFQKMKFNFESYNAPRISGATDNPFASVAVYNVQGNFTLDMSVLAGLLSNGDATLFTAYITSNGAYTLSINNAGTLKYVGSAADLAITNSGLLLNVLLTKNTSGDVTSIAQASKLS